MKNTLIGAYKLAVPVINNEKAYDILGVIPNMTQGGVTVMLYQSGTNETGILVSLTKSPSDVRREKFAKCLFQSNIDERLAKSLEEQGVAVKVCEELISQYELTDTAQYPVYAVQPDLNARYDLPRDDDCVWHMAYNNYSLEDYDYELVH
jgi:hypothetical protein